MSFRSLAALALGSGLSACGASGDAAFSLPDETPRDAARDHVTAEPPDTAPEAEADPPSDATAVDAACSACISATVSWGDNGGFAPIRETSTISKCHAYTHEVEGVGGPASCSDEFVTCDGEGPLSPGLLARALDDAYVQTALEDEAPVLYGTDPRPVDGSVFRMVIDGKIIEIGACAASDEQCVPPGVASLANLLRAIDDELLQRAPCSDAFQRD